jgi:Domain of unknown function (4846)
MNLKLLSCILTIINCNAILPDSKFINSKGKTIKDRILVPEGFTRIIPSVNSFGEYLQYLPLKKNGSKVLLYNGEIKKPEDVYVAVLTVDVGNKDLQQCADAVMRLRAEYLFGKGRYDEIHFNFTNGFNAEYEKYAQGYRFYFKGNSVFWKKTKEKDYTYTTFKKYLEVVYTFAGSASLTKELQKVKSLDDIKIGDVFIKGGSPGHAVIVVDSAKSKVSDEVIFLLAQSYMPAQDIQILKNPEDESLSPWYSNKIKDKLYTPEWDFKKTDLKRFKDD